MSTVAKAKLRIGRIVLVLAVLLGLYWLITWVQGNADKITAMDKNMQGLSVQLAEQKEQMQNLNRALSRFSGGLGQLQQHIVAIQKQSEVQGQSASHALQEIANNVLNMKGKIDVLSNMRGNGYYGR